MPKAIDPDAVFPYVLKDDRELKDGHKDKTVFQLGTLKARKYAGLQDSAITVTGGKKDRETNCKSGTVELDVLHEGLKGWSNFNDENGDPIEFETSDSRNAMDRNLSRLRHKHREELADVITDGAEPDEEEVKNSPSQDTSPPVN